MIYSESHKNSFLLLSDILFSGNYSVGFVVLFKNDYNYQYLTHIYLLLQAQIWI